jgi:hypothetical protein
MTKTCLCVDKVERVMAFHMQISILYSLCVIVHLSDKAFSSDKLPSHLCCRRIDLFVWFMAGN